MSKPAEARQKKVRTEAAQRRNVVQIARGLSATVGKDFFQSIVNHLAATFQADCAYLGELAGTPIDRIRTVAVSRGQQSARNFEQKLSGTASGQVFLDGSFACMRDARRLFPLDDLIETLDAEGYLGIRLSDSTGLSTGLLAMVFKRELAKLQMAKSVLDAFVPRAAAELERKRSDDIHREIEERHQAFISTSPDAMWRIELEQPMPLSLGEEEQFDHIYRLGYLAECNEALAHMAGVEGTEELVGLRFGEITGRLNPSAREELRDVIRAGFEPTTVETIPNRRAGEEVYWQRSQWGIKEDGQLRRIWGTTRDITSLRLTELSLVASENRFREVLEGIQLPAVMLDLRGAVTFANESFLRLTQRSMEDLAELTWLNGVAPAAECETWKTKLLPDDSGNSVRFHFEGSVLPKDGPPHVVAWDAIGLYDQDDLPAGVAAIGRDITLQRALELEIQKAQKLDSIGRLAAGVAHDFNNLLMVVLGHATQLLLDVDESDPAHERLAAIESAALQCTTLTGQLLAIGRKQHLRPQRISLNEVITADRGILEGLIRPDIELILDLAPALGPVYADPTQVQRTLANLVSNARDAMPMGGKLTVATSCVTIGPEEAMYPGVKPGAYVRLSVSDTGIGLTEEVRARLFEPFFTTKAPGKGTGLGLSTVHGIVTQGGGHVAVQSEVGKGTRFDILLPGARD